MNDEPYVTLVDERNVHIDMSNYATSKIETVVRVVVTGQRALGGYN